MQVEGPRCFCWSCGVAIPGWWSFDLADDDAAYEHWRDTPCPACGKTPREGEPKATPER